MALHKAEVNALQQAFRQLATQNQKLHVNNRDINRRAALLAQEVDERHTHLEQSARVEIRQLEKRHTDIIRDLTAKMATDRENWSALTAKLEARLKTFEVDETRLRQDYQAVQQDNSALEADHMAVQKQLTELLEENIRLNNEIVDVGERQRTEECIKDDRENEELLELIDKISALQVENANLRDKNDELVSEVEEKTMELTKFRLAKKAARLDLVNDIDSDCSATAAGASAVKRRGDSPSKAKICEESPKLGKLRKCSNTDAAGDSESSGDWMALNSELQQSAAASAAAPSFAGTTSTTSGFSQDLSSLNDCKDEEIKQLQQKVRDLEGKVSGTKAGNSAEKLETRNQELEVSLEQMRKEFEDLEDYWQGKLTEERQLYEAEQQKSHDKFDDLLKKMAEYEEQFLMENANKDGRLSPIEERCQLEQQYTELEQETEDIKCQAREMLNKKAAEISALQEKVKRLQHRIVDANANGSQASRTPERLDSAASSPISYLWLQSTIQAPARDYQNPNWSGIQINVQNPAMLQADDMSNNNEPVATFSKAISPIQRPASPFKTKDTVTDKPDSDASSVKSFGTHSVASTHSM